MPNPDVLFALFVSGLTLLFLWQNVSRQRGKKSEPCTGVPEFLFHKGTLIHSNAPALAFIAAHDQNASTWVDLRDMLAPRFGDLPNALLSTQETLSFRDPNEKTGARAVIELNQDYARLALVGLEDQSCAKALKAHHTFRIAARNAPFPIWKVTKDGDLIWANKMFKTKGLGAIQLPKPKKNNQGVIRITGPESPTSKTNHFDVLSQSVKGGVVYYALDANAAVTAEETRQEFVTALGKTFAQLSTGIAVFDQRSKLVLFNPALVELFGLSATFLTNGPTLQSFFDHMRNNRMIPEPRDYNTWREQLTNLILGASEGRYREIWQLPTGESIRVTGQPHPDGALGFLFEDISAEVSMSRRFKSDLTRAYGILDALPDPTLAINQNGVVFFANEAFKSQWKADPESSFADFTIADLLEVLSSKLPQKLIGEIERALTKPDQKKGARIRQLGWDIHINRTSEQVIVLKLVQHQTSAQPQAHKKSVA
ncbi:PAS-domain containing protein [Cognatishimia activa]|uniref:Sensor protein DivL n=1 Tax=Cognatishimia activa TaxID=1715691 RepID=A0A0N7MB66_9RHOB|nr:PAS-domain containing protein [Cognatishimia activa]CUI40506.1 Sensor protein DivL [Cognatishimia activa]CUK24552.1 Sensor protein DivL [Cognatishimia activa]